MKSTILCALSAVGLAATVLDAGSASAQACDPRDGPICPVPGFVSTTIGPAGGVVETEGVHLTIPPGALSEPQEITIEWLDQPATPVMAVTNFYSFGPEGLRFQLPVTVKLQRIGQALPQLPPLGGLRTAAAPGGGGTFVYWSNDTGNYDEVGPTLVTEGVVVATGTHFSTIGAAQPVRAFDCRPVKPTCRMQGCSCYAGTDDLFRTPDSFAGGDFAGWNGNACTGYDRMGQFREGKLEGCNAFSYEAPDLCEIRLSETRYPDSVGHIRSVYRSRPGWEILHLSRNEGQAASRRKGALDAFKAEQEALQMPYVPEKNFDLDEYPFAMTMEGGPSASVRKIKSSDNRGSGSCAGNQARGLPDGTPVKIVLVP